MQNLMPNYKEDELDITNTIKDSEFVMIWVGSSHEQEPSENLRPYLVEFLEKFDGNKLKVDFCTLDLMNSSTVIIIIEFVKNLEKKQIQTEINYDENNAWQRTSFLALNKVVINYKHVSIIGI